MRAAGTAITRTAIRYAALWLLVVAVGSSVAWAAIRGTGPQSSALAGAPVRVGVTPAPTAPTAPGDPAAPGVATVTPDRAPGAGSGASPRPPTRSVDTPAVAGTPPVEGSMVTRGGTFAVACTGTRLTLRSARPKDGWRMEGPEAADGGLKVSFEASDEEITLVATCVAGQPQITAHDD